MADATDTMREALEKIAGMSKEMEHDLFSATQVAREALAEQPAQGEAVRTKTCIDCGRSVLRTEPPTTTGTVGTACVPDGWKLVPVEPTDGMLIAARDWSNSKYGKPVGDDGAMGCYAAMLAAAPEVPRG